MYLLLTELIKGIKLSIQSTMSIVEFFNSISQGISAFCILNCNFLHKNVNLFFKSLDHELAFDLRNLGFYSIYVGLFITIASWFSILAINRLYNIDKRQRLIEKNSFNMGTTNIEINI
jgi:hypothetical protein